MAALDLDKHVFVQKPLCWSVDEARKLSRKAQQTPKAVTQMGNQGHSWRRWPHAPSSGSSRARSATCARSHVWTNRPLSYWPQGIPRPEPRRISEQHGLEHDRRDGASRQRDGPLFGARSTVVGSVPRPRAGLRISPGLPPVQLARLDRLGLRRDRRHGRAPDRLRVLGARSWLSDHDRNGVDAVRWRVLPDGHQDLLRIPGARHDAAGEADVVRRRHDAGDAARARRRRSSTTIRRRAHRRQQGQGDARQLRREVAAVAGLAARSRSAIRRRRSSASPSATK